MRIKQQTTYDLNSEQFRYLKRVESIQSHRVDINELNKRLNRTKKNSFYSTIVIALLSFSFLTILILIGIKF